MEVNAGLAALPAAWNPAVEVLCRAVKGEAAGGCAPLDSRASTSHGPPTTRCTIQPWASSREALLVNPAAGKTGLGNN